MTSLFADAKMYIGANYGSYNETFFSGADTTTLTDTIKTKIGYGVRDSYAFEFSLEYTKNKESIFSEAGSNDKDKIGINIELLKAFDFDIYINPFFKAGFGVGKLDIEQQGTDIYGNIKEVDSLSFGSFNLGVGTFIPINEHFDIEIGYEYKYLAYENFDTTTTSENRGPMFESHVSVGYIGFNIRF